MPRNPTIPRTCQKCGVGFLALPYQVKCGRALYCSHACLRARYGQPIVLSDDGMTAMIPLCGRDGSVRAHALIDAPDAIWAGQWVWGLHSAGYAQRLEKSNGRQRIKLLHRELLGLIPGDGRQADHIDRDRLNNRRSNLRIVTSAGNQQNLTARLGGSVYRGVYFDKRRSVWNARITIDYVCRHLGSFATEEEAGEAARAARARLMLFATD